MGEIYRATDTRLDRAVAIKILPSHLSLDEGRRQRFEREARTISSLSHPNICSLFDVGREDDIDYLVMELLEGETLADRVARGPLPTEQVLRYGIEIASALDRAHRQHVIHRDLKPANVMLTRAGAKLLDFGLARIALASEGDALVHADGATEHRPLTQEGTILGTVQYMAPEQLEGKEADARTDIFALGVLLYEMMTGKRPFAGASRASVIAAILERQPQAISEIQPLTPPPLERVIRTCLAKDPEERWQSAHDVAAELRWISEGGSQPAIATPGRDVRHKRILQKLAWAALGIAAGALVTIGAYRLRPAAREGSVMRFDVPTAASAPMLVSRYPNLAISPDGTAIAYVGIEGDTSRLYLRRLDRLGATPIAGTEGARAPFFSPDGRWIAFTDLFGRGSFRKVSVDGGAPTKLGDHEAVVGGWWSDDGSMLYVRQFSEGVWRLPPSGGQPELVARPDTAKGDRALVYPQLLPGAKYILATAWTGKSFDEARIVAYPLGKGERKVVVEGGAFGRVVSSGHLVFVRAGQLFAAPFDPERVETTGAPVAVIDDVYAGIANGEAYFSEARNGTLLYAPGIHSSPPRQLVWVDRTGKEELAVPTTRQYADPSIAPDSRSIAVGIQEAKFDIWTIDLERDVATRLSFGEDDGNPIMSPDGSRVVYDSSRDGAINLYVRAADGSTPEVKFTTAKNETFTPTSWASNDRILFTSRSQHGLDVFMTEAKPGATPVPVLASDFQESEARVSPDGRWLLYTSDESGTPEVYLQAFPGPGVKTQVSVGGGTTATWSWSGREIFYVNERKRIMVVDVESSPKIRVSRPRVFLENDSYALENGFAISRDDRRLLVVKMDRSQLLARNMVVVVNWDEELRRRVPNGR